MNPQTKQKALFSVLLALVMGMGYFWFFGNDSSVTQTQSSGKFERKQRAAKTVEPEKRQQAVKSKAESSTERKVRERREPTETKRKSRRRGQKQVKKKKMSPAA